MTEKCLTSIDVVVLAGGLGTRMRDVLGDRPKLLAPIGGRVFLDILVDRLRDFGATRLVLGLGHLGEAVVRHLEAAPPAGFDVVTEIEPEPQGTAGALRFLRAQIRSEPAMVMNGDSFTGADLCAFVAAHRQAGAEGSILCTEVPDARAYGRVHLSPTGRVMAFMEKDPSEKGPGLINAGVYLLGRALLDQIAGMKGPSLERDVFPALAPETLKAVKDDAPFIDIGTPEDLERAPDVLAPFMSGAGRSN